MKNFANKHAEHRYKRAALARRLLQEHIKGNLESTAHCTWDVLDALPEWCAMHYKERMQLQVISGAYLLAPTMQLWIDRRVIQAAIAIIGEQAFNDAIAFYAQPAHPTCDLSDFQNGNTLGASQFATNQFVESEHYQQRVHSAFEQAGNLVLKGSLSTNTPKPLSLFLCPENTEPDALIMPDKSPPHSFCIALIERVTSTIEKISTANPEAIPASKALSDQPIHSGVLNGNSAPEDTTVGALL